MEQRTSFLLLFLFPLGWALFTIGPDLVRRSMYNDGIWYASISRNLAEDRGTLWFPFLSETIHTRFHEHPPLGFGIQSLMFRCLGDGLATERIYSLIILVLTIAVMVGIGRKVSEASQGRESIALLAICLWLLNEITYRVAPSNLLETTMGLLDLCAAALLLGKTRERWWSLPAAAACIAAALLVKGPAAAYPLALPFATWITGLTPDRKRMLIQTSTLILLVMGGLGSLLLIDDARESLTTYVRQQIWSSMTSQRTEYHHRASQAWILGRLLVTQLPAIGMLILIRLSRPRVRIQAKDRVWMFLLIMGAVASLPLMISPKQADYYLYPSLPWYALAMARLVQGPWQELISGLTDHRFLHRGVLVIGVGLVVAGAIRTSTEWGKVVERDQEVWQDVQHIRKVAGDGATVSLWMPGDSLQDQLALSSYLIGYLQRKARIHVDTSGKAWPVHLRWHEDKRPVPDWLTPVDIPAVRYPIYRNSNATLSRPGID